MQSSSLKEIKAALWEQAFLGGTRVSCPMGQVMAIRRRKGQLLALPRGWGRWYPVESVRIENTGLSLLQEGRRSPPSGGVLARSMLSDQRGCSGRWRFWLFLCEDGGSEAEFVPEQPALPFMDGSSDARTKVVEREGRQKASPKHIREAEEEAKPGEKSLHFEWQYAIFDIADSYKHDKISLVIEEVREEHLSRA